MILLTSNPEASIFDSKLEMPPESVIINQSLPSSRP
jgi:hypothetical protein